MADINLTCVECNNDFYFSDKDQKFYADRGFQRPKRCWHCRQKRKNNGSQAPQQQQPAVQPAQTKPKGKRYRDEDDSDF